MKKFALCIVILTALLTAAACSTTPTPTRTVRWEAGEKLVYDVSFIPNPDDTPVYLEGEIKGAAVIPDDVSGTYTAEVISVDDKKTTLVTTLDIWNTYPVSKTGDMQTLIDNLKIPQDRITEENSEDEKVVRIRSTVINTVVFPLSTCVSSKTEGQSFSLIVTDVDKETNAKTYSPFYYEYEAECTDFSVSSPSVSLTVNGEQKNQTLSLSGSVNYTDNAALLYIVRSLNLDTLTQASSTSFSVTDIVSGSIRSVSVSNTENESYTEAIGEDTSEMYKIRIYTDSTTWGGYNYLYIDLRNNIEETPENVIDGPAEDICKNRILYIAQAYMLFSLRQS